MEKIDISQHMMDKVLIQDIKDEIKKIYQIGHKIHEIQFPMMAIHDTLMNLSKGALTPFTVCFCGIPVQMSDDTAIHVRHFIQDDKGIVMMYNSSKQLSAEYGIKN